MRTSEILAPLFFAATALAQGPPEGIAPSTAPPSGCQPNASGNFTIGTLKVGHSNSKRETAREAADSALVCSLTNGILRDRDGRTGSVVANRQFQFDGPPQAGAIYTGGFAVCSNGSLAIGGSTRWWQCSSGPFYNLYDEWIGAQCEEIRIQVTFPEKQVSSSAVMSSVAVASSSVPVATVQSSLATITGAVSTVSKSAIGPSASFASSASSNASMPSGSASGSTAASGSVSATRSGSSAPSGSSTGAPAAPAAGGAAPVSFGVARGSMAAAFVVIFGAALIL